MEAVHCHTTDPTECLSRCPHRTQTWSHSRTCRSGCFDPQAPERGKIA